MSFDKDRNYDRVLWEGIRALKDGSKNLAWALLTQATELNPYEATPWLWLSKATDDPLEQEEYLDKALSIDPTNVAALKGLEEIRKGLGEKVDELPFNPNLSRGKMEIVEPVIATAKRVFLCPSCGAHMEFQPETTSFSCLYCGLTQEMKESSAADDEQVMAKVLPTAKGHRWASAQQRMICSRCGANSIWPPGQTAVECPYCGSRQLLKSKDTEELLDPQGIAIMQIDEDLAAKNIVDWLGKGWTAPDDLQDSARKSLLRSAYYPFWTFDGTLEVNWSCYVNESIRERNDWEPRNGVEFELFDDVLIPGLKSINIHTFRKLGMYNLKDVVDFKPTYLAGWPALTYDRPLAEATLLAREQVIRKVRRDLHVRVLPGVQKRDIQTGGLNWHNMTFKLILLPVWIGQYRYRGKKYPVMVNGQTGYVAGEKPKDHFKTIGILIGVIFTMIVLFLVGALLASVFGWW